MRRRQLARQGEKRWVFAAYCVSGVTALEGRVTGRDEEAALAPFGGVRIFLVTGSGAFEEAAGACSMQVFGRSRLSESRYQTLEDTSHPSLDHWDTYILSCRTRRRTTESRTRRKQIQTIAKRRSRGSSR